MKLHIITIIMTLIITSCQNANNNNSSTIEGTLPISIKEEAPTLSSEEIPIKHEFYNALKFHTYNDSILIVVNKSNANNHTIELYNMNSDKIIKSLIRYGRGHGEMINISAHINKNKLYVRDFSQKKLAIIDLDSVLGNTNYKLNEFINYPRSSFVTCMGRDSLIYINPLYFENKEMDINNNEPLILKTCINKEYQENTVKKISAYNVTQGAIVENQNRIVTVSSSLSEACFFDTNLNLIKKLTRPDKLNVMYYVDKEKNSLSFHKQAPYTYLGEYCATDEFVYFIYHGEFYNDNYKSFTSYIFKFSWDGEFIKSYKYPKYISSISKIKDKEEFYATGYGANGEKTLIHLF